MGNFIINEKIDVNYTKSDRIYSQKHSVYNVGNGDNYVRVVNFNMCFPNNWDDSNNWNDCCHWEEAV